MLLRELLESPNETVGLIFGRFNPPHKGHRAAWEMASKETHWFVGTNANTQGPKDPLPYQIKIKCMEAIWPEVVDHIIPHQSWLTLAVELYRKYPDATLVLFTDEQWVSDTINKYNGQEMKMGTYNFKEIVTKPTPRISSATALRNAVLDDNPKEFEQAAGVPANTVIELPGKNKEFFDLVKEYLEPHRDAIAKAAAKKTKGKK